MLTAPGRVTATRIGEWGAMPMLEGIGALTAKPTLEASMETASMSK
jgi:hypothetical protein